MRLTGGISGRENRVLKLSAASMLCGVGLASLAAGQSSTYSGPGGGNWSDPSRWTPNGPPTSGSALLFPFDELGGGTPIIVTYDLPTITSLALFGRIGTPHAATLNIPMGGITASTFTIGSASSASGDFTVNATNAALSASTLTIGASLSNGSLNQSGGMTTATRFALGSAGRFDNITSSYALTGGGTANVGSLTIGDAGATATFSMDSGTFNVQSDALCFTSDARTGKDHQIVLAGGLLNVGGNQIIGNANARGTLTISGSAENRIAGKLSIGLGSGSTFLNVNPRGAVVQSGGTLSAGSVQIGQTLISATNARALFETTGGVASFGSVMMGGTGGGSSTFDVNGTAQVTVSGPFEIDDNSELTVSNGRLRADRVAVQLASSLAKVSLKGGTLELTAPVGATGSRLRYLSFSGGTGAWNGQLDLGQSAAVIDVASATPFALVAEWIRSGYAGGSWNGTGIASSAAAATPGTAIGYVSPADIGSPATFFGQPVQQFSTLIRYTLAGDADLNGTTDISDFARLAANFNTPTNRWFDGNFNYDNMTNIADFALLAGNFNQSLPAPRSSVPEPAALGTCGLAVTAALTRRRLRRK